MEKTFTHAGVSKLDGKFKFRVANGISRIEVLIRNGHTDIDLIQLKEPMTKEQAVQYLCDIRFYETDGFENAEVRAALEAELKKKEPKAAKAPKEPKAAVDKPVKEKRVTKLDLLKRATPGEGISISKLKTPEPVLTKEAITEQLADLEDMPF